MPEPSAVRDGLAAVDAMDTPRFVSFFTPDGIFRFGNAPAAVGREAIGQMVGQFFASIAGLRHDVLGVWSEGEMVFCQGDVTYTRRDGRQVGPLPFLNVYRMQGEQFKEWLVYADASPLFAA